MLRRSRRRPRTARRTTAGLLAAMAAASGALAACGDGEGDVAAPVGLPVVSVPGAGADGDVVVVEGFVVLAPEAPHRICAALAESYPPQCGGASLELVGLEPGRLGGTSTNEELPEGERTTWSDDAIRLTGTVDGDQLVLVRSVEDLPSGWLLVESVSGDVPLAGADVELWGGDGQVASTVTDALGVAALPAPDGTFEVVALPVEGLTAPARTTARAGDALTLAYRG